MYSREYYLNAAAACERKARHLNQRAAMYRYVAQRHAFTPEQKNGLRRAATRSDGEARREMNAALTLRASAIIEQSQ